MNSPILCQHCESNIPNSTNYYFCPQCLGQIRCKSCDEILIKNASGCVGCGTPLIGKDNQKNGAVNTIEFEQKGNNKKFSASFTDNVGENLVSSLSSLFVGSTHRIAQNPFEKAKVTRRLSENKGLENKSKKEVQIEDVEFVDLQAADLDASLTNIFRSDNSKLTLINSRLKQTGKRDQAIRITILTLYAYSHLGQNQVKKSEVAEILNSAAVYDNNYLTWLSKCDEIKVDGENLELNLPGRDAAIDILKEFNDPSIEKGAVVFSAISSKSVRKGKDKRAKHNDVKDSSDSQLTTKSTSRSNSKMTPVKMLDILIGEDYFLERKRVPEILTYCKDIKGQTLNSSTLSTALLRKVKNNILKREKNVSDNQYEYYQQK